MVCYSQIIIKCAGTSASFFKIKIQLFMHISIMISMFILVCFLDPV